LKIGVLSDSHDHLQHLKKALQRLHEEKASLVIHCGDLTTPHTAEILSGFRVVFVAGNCDRERERIYEVLAMLNPQNFAGPLYTGVIEGVRIAAIHGDDRKKLTELLYSASYDYIFTGHTHRAQERSVGPTRLINPGALTRSLDGYPSLYLLDLATRAGQFIQIG
jgi:hypothetical protein